MGAFNELTVGSNGEELSIQFKYGLAFQRCYRIGDKVEFAGGTPNGESEIPGSARSSDGGWKYFSIKFRDDEIVSYREIDQEEFDRLSIDLESQ